MGNSNQKQKPAGTLAAITTNTSTTPIDVDGFDEVLIAVALTLGSGNATYKLEGAITAGGTKLPLTDSAGASTITQTAVGSYPHSVDVAGMAELYITAIDITTGVYTLTVDHSVFSRGDGR